MANKPMSHFSNHIREAINLLGVEILKSEKLIYILSDFQAFDSNAWRTVLRTMIRNGITTKMYEKYVRMDDVDNLYLCSVVTQLVREGLRHDVSIFVVKSIAKALGWINDEPQWENDTTITQEPNMIEYCVDDVKFLMCEVLGGKFSMGATPEQGITAAFDERPAVEVEVDTFYIGETPVTQKLWKAVMNSNPSHFPGDDRPVERVSWDECIEFIEKLNAMTGLRFRLPTEAEWEYAARGGCTSEKTKYAGTDDGLIEEYFWYRENSHGTTHEIKKKRPNELGLYDMSGNVSEWCSDWYYNSYANNTTRKNPHGPAMGITKVIRGGSWNDKPIGCRVSKRNSLNPSYRNKQIGFRLAINL